VIRHFPDFDAFVRLAARHAWIPVYRRLLDDTLTPVSAFHRVDAGSSACLFESVIGGEKVGRYSFLAAEPFMEIEAEGPTVRVRRDGKLQSFEAADPLEELRRRVAAIRVATLAELPPFTSGAVGYAGYDVVRYVEHLPNAPANDRCLPDLAFAFYDHMIVFDHVQKTVVVVAMARLDEPGVDVRGAYEKAQRRVDQLVGQLQAPLAPAAAKAPAPVELAPDDIDLRSTPRLDYRSNFTREAFERAVERCVEYIRAGDIFQVVISQRLELPLRSHPFEIYRTLRVVNPSPFMFYLRTPRVTLVGSSPEVMVRVVGGRVTVRPLAGTRRRGATPEEDRRLAEELLSDEKERAEHVMLVDLGRNDVGRVARYRSVELTDVMTIERYSHVMHITSNVSGELAEGRDAFDALKACLPAGTVSGAPKVRAMEIIDEIEPHRRGPYAGAVGYVDFNGNMDTCIALRTLVVPTPEPTAGGSTVDKKTYVQVGAGIVADSQPAEEYQETLNKARGLLLAIAITDERVGAQGQAE
jgi:anthranilate synthase component 1